MLVFLVPKKLSGTWQILNVCVLNERKSSTVTSAGISGKRTSLNFKNLVNFAFREI
jgi:hypothetical protein